MALQLKKDIKIKVASLGINITKNSSQLEINSALKHQPNLSQYFEEIKPSNNGKSSKENINK